MPTTGSCGKGQKTGNCSGEACEVATKTVDCRVKCAKEAVNNEAPVEVDGEEAVMTEAPARGGGRPGKGRRPGKGGNGKGQENSGTGNGRRPEKPSRGGRKPNKNDKPAKAKGEKNYYVREFVISRSSPDVDWGFFRVGR